MNNILDIAEKIFLNQPKPSCSIQLLLDEADNNTIFEVLVLFLLKGISIKFNDLNVSREKVYNHIYSQFNEYFHSFGFNINLNITEYKPLTFSKKLYFCPSEEFNLDMCMLYKVYIDNKEIYIDYNSEIVTDLLKNFILVILMKNQNGEKYLVNVAFNFYIEA